MSQWGKAMALSFLILCSCARQISTQSLTLPEQRMNTGAGRQKLLIVTVALASGEKLPMVLDTGASATCFDTSLATKLGPPVKTATNWTFGVPSITTVYRAPRLYLGGLRLTTGEKVITFDCSQMPAWVPRPVMGAIGMDVLRHYCVQLDFSARRIRFLNSEQAVKADWGIALPMVELEDGLRIIRGNLAGMEGSGSLIDTGCNQDGWLASELFQRWTNRALIPIEGEVRAPNGVLGGVLQPEIGLFSKDLQLTDDVTANFNGVGLRFLSRYTVTFDFPNGIMFLKQTRSVPKVMNEK